MGFFSFTPRASPTVFGLLWASLQDYPPISCPTTTIAQYMFVAPLLILWQNSILFVLDVYLYL